jgi:hypothetical protein
LPRITGLAMRLPKRRWALRRAQVVIGGPQLRQLPVLARHLTGAEDGHDRAQQVGCRGDTDVGELLALEKRISSSPG